MAAETGSPGHSLGDHAKENSAVADRAIGKTVPKRVAVIAVHGVGDQKPGNTARDVARLLGRGPWSGGLRYACFEETEIHLPVQRPTGLPETSQDPGIDLTLRSLGKLERDDELAYYSSVKLKGLREGPEPISVDIFEMYWADLSRASGFALKFLAELYQLFFHLASLGRKTVQTACHQAIRDERPVGTRSFLRALSATHRAIEFLLPGAIPVFNLFLLVPVVLLCTLLLPESIRGHRQELVLIGGMLAGFFVTIAVSYLNGIRHGVLLGVVVAAGAGYALHVVNDAAFAEVALGLGAMAATLVFAWWGCWQLLDRYSKRVRIGAPAAATALLAVLLVNAAFSASGINSLSVFDRLLLVAGDVTGQLFAILQWSWAALAVLLFAASLAPLVAWILRLDDKVRRALRTGRIGAMVSATLFFLLTATLWAALLHQVKAPLDGYPLTITPTWALLHQSASPSCAANMKLNVFADCLFELTIGNNANVFLVLLGLALLLVVGALLPSVWHELSAPRPPPAADRGRAVNLWNWLNTAGRVLWITELTLLLACAILAAGYERLLPAPDWLPVQDLGGSSWLIAGGAVLASALPLAVLFRDQIPNRFTAILDIAFDVSNWLKERPFERNPRGRILCRYLSLLREICRQGTYDRIVIVSHSQGTVISADFLRLLHYTGARGLLGTTTAIPEIRLLTAGSPLRQIYSCRFPTLYGWAENPDINTLPIASWINVYRCGDYVGRDLWGGGADAAELGSARRGEALRPGGQNLDCSLGLGAHTHYFDGTAEEVAIVIDHLVAM